jgi:hypothetical protein
MSFKHQVLAFSPAQTQGSINSKADTAALSRLTISLLGSQTSDMRAGLNRCDRAASGVEW